MLTLWVANSKCCIMRLWNVHLVILHYITATQVEHILYGTWKWTYFAADQAQSHSYPCAFQAPLHSLSSGKLHLHERASGGWYNSSDTPQWWWRIMQFPYEWLCLHSTDLCIWKIGIFKMGVCVFIYVCMQFKSEPPWQLIPSVL